METTFFSAFLSSEAKGIKIPRLQRDYVQGTNAGVKTGFCQSLINVLEDKNSETLSLNFVYGLNENLDFIPIDGQQRLTTLWLLHLYVHSRSSRLNETNEICKLQYETRDSARKFCEVIREHLKDICDSSKPLRIDDQKWYYESWSKDTTVEGMIATLDYFHNKWKTNDTAFFDEIWGILCSDECPIRFSFIDNEEENLNRDIYLKMNSRGRLLSEYEKLKSWLDEKLIALPDKQLLPDSKIKWQSKLDNEWTEMIWRRRIHVKSDNGNELDNIDLEQLRLIYNLFGLFWTLNFSGKEGFNGTLIQEGQLETTSELLGFEANRKTDSTKNPRVFQQRLLARMIANKNYSIPLYILDRFDIAPASFFNKAIEWYDSIYTHYMDIEKAKDILQIDDESIFYKYFLDSSHSYPDAVYFAAILLFIQSGYKFSEDGQNQNFLDWIRVIRNIIKNSSIETVDSYIGAVNLVAELANCLSDNYSFNIYHYLAQVEISSKYAQSQMNEEVYKAKIIFSECSEEDYSSKKLIHKMEDLKFMLGKIEFAFYSVDLIPDASQYVIGSFFKRKEQFEQLYCVIRDSIELRKDISNDFRRLLFASDDHKFYNYWGTYSYSLALVKRRAILNCEDLSLSFRTGDNKKYLKATLLNIISHGSEEKAVNALSVGIQQECEVPNWVVRLITEPDLLDKHCGGYHYFAIDDNVCYLFNGAARPTDIQSLYKVE